MEIAVVVLVALCALLVVVLVRRPGTAGPVDLIQQQLIELRARLDQLVAAQQEVPKALAQGSAAQAGLLSDVRERLGALGEATRRLEAVGATVTEVQRLLQVPKLQGTTAETWRKGRRRQFLPRSPYDLPPPFRPGGRVDAPPKLGDRRVA